MIVSLLTKKWWLSGIHWYDLALILSIVFIPSFIYYSTVAKGLVWNDATGIFHYNFAGSFEAIKMSVTNTYDITNVNAPTAEAYNLVKSAMGLDLLQYSWSGIAFRIVQLLTQVLVVVGFIWMLVKRYNMKSEYVAGCICAFGLLGLCVILPAFGSMINATRQYHIALMFLALCFVLGFDAIENGWRWAVK